MDFKIDLVTVKCLKLTQRFEVGTEVCVLLRRPVNFYDTTQNTLVALSNGPDVWL